MFDNKTCYKVYPSDAIPPRLYGVVKAHKPEKNYLMRTIVSTIRTVPYGTSKCLVEIIQLTLNKNINCVINWYTFVKEAKTWEIYQDKVQVSYDVVNSYPSVPVDKAVKVLMAWTTAKNIFKNNRKDNRNDTNWKKILWIPNIGPKIRKEFKKVKKGITFTSGKNWQTILCQNKPKLLPNSHPGVYQLDCSCNGWYIDESKKKV